MKYQAYWVSIFGNYTAFGTLEWPVSLSRIAEASIVLHFMYKATSYS
jgi:hypothetical protein